MTFHIFRFTSTNHFKIFKNLSKKPQNPFKTGPGRLPKRHSKKQQEKDPQNRQKVKICSLTGSVGGGVAKSVFGSFSSPGDPWNQNGPKTSPKSLRDPPGRHFFMIFGQFWTPVFGSCCCFVGLFSLSLWHARTKEQIRMDTTTWCEQGPTSMNHGT